MYVCVISWHNLRSFIPVKCVYFPETPWVHRRFRLFSFLSGYLSQPRSPRTSAVDTCMFGVAELRFDLNFCWSCIFQSLPDHIDLHIGSSPQFPLSPSPSLSVSLFLSASLPLSPSVSPSFSIFLHLSMIWTPHLLLILVLTILFVSHTWNRVN